MKQLVFVKLLLVAIALLAVGWAILPASDEAAIRKQLKTLARACEKMPAQSVIRSVVEANDLRSFFTSNATINLGSALPTSLQRRDIPALLTRIHTAVDSLAITIQGVDFEPRKTRNEREIRAAVEFAAQTGALTENHLDEFRIQWRKVERTWLIESVQADGAISRPIDY